MNQKIKKPTKKFSEKKEKTTEKIKLQESINIMVLINQLIKFNLKDGKNKLKLPNLSGIKSSVIQNIQNKKVNSARTELIDNLKKKMDKNNNADTLDFGKMQSQAQENNILYNQEADGFNLLNYKDEKKSNEMNKEMSRKTYSKELKEVIANSDVILEVLDARDPLSCRSKDLESQILSHRDGKKIILVVNKIDLVPM